MDIKLKKIQSPELLTSADYIYKCPSFDLPKLTISIFESSNSTRFESYSRNSPKKVSFNKNVTIVNIQSYKKCLKKQKIETFPSAFEDDYNDDNKNCANCEIF